jgi:uncharacterized membrane protein
LAGIPATLQASLSAKEVQTTEFRLVTERGDTIQELPMNAASADRTFLEFVGTFQPPQQPFRVAVTGLDATGQTYQRFFASLFHAETVEVSPAQEFDELAAGDTEQLTFAVRNIGPPTEFKITVTDARHFVGQVVPSQLMLDTGESGTIWVHLTVPAGSAAGIGDDIIVVATSRATPASSNSSVIHVSVSASTAR